MKMQFLARPMMAIVAIGSMTLPSVGAAQTEARTSAQLSPVCMARNRDAIANVKAAERGKAFHVLTVEAGVAGFEAKGFERVKCQQAQLAKAAQRSAYRDRVCNLASTGNEAVQKQLARSFGERPSVLCANAQLVAGPFQRDTRAAEHRLRNQSR